MSKIRKPLHGYWNISTNLGSYTAHNSTEAIEVLELTDPKDSVWIWFANHEDGEGTDFIDTAERWIEGIKERETIKSIRYEEVVEYWDDDES